ncbi:MAG TPA: Na+/H+ antiporter NhaA, partial [Actinomycetaceae bacterium]|nr:Na+/H+ antiporter NhaA [Actinomycetaceae bacterium]
MTELAPRRGIVGGYRQRLSNETFAGIVLLTGALVALIWANSPWRDGYANLAATTVGPEALHLSMSLADWAADGLLVIFFFVIGLELKDEFVNGSLRRIRRAAVPVIAAVFGMLGPAAVYLGIQAVSGSGEWDGWAIPVATDIAFATALLGIFGRGFPPALRTFLLTLAVVDDLLGITIIATVFTDSLNFVLLGCSFLVIAAFAVLVQKRVTSWWLILPLAVVAWGLMHASGVHATVAGVLLGMAVPARRTKVERISLADRFQLRVGWISAGIVLPV